MRAATLKIFHHSIALNGVYANNSDYASKRISQEVFSYTNISFFFTINYVNEMWNAVIRTFSLQEISLP